MLSRISVPQLSLKMMLEAFRTGHPPSDEQFDEHLPEEVQSVSDQYWTPIAVAVRAARWFERFRIRSVVDIGSGAGKFCVVASLVSPCCFLGIEHRPRFVKAARELASKFALGDRVRFEEGVFGEVPHAIPDAYYLYNPFGENLFDGEEHMDEDVELSASRHRRDVAAVLDALERAPIGTYALTFNGFGAELPKGYRGLLSNRETASPLYLAIKEK